MPISIILFTGVTPIYTKIIFGVMAIPRTYKYHRFYV